MGVVVIGSGFTPATPPLSTMQSPTRTLAFCDQREGENVLTIEIVLNNQSFHFTRDSAADVANAVSRLRADPEHARELKKELILNADLLIALMNETKIAVQYKNPYLAYDRHCYGRIELAFIENKHLSVCESEWVRETIGTYKQRVKRAVAQNSPKPITPPPSVISMTTFRKCSCSIV
jgi:hypothetical protein